MGPFQAWWVWRSDGGQRSRGILVLLCPSSQFFLPRPGIEGKALSGLSAFESEQMSLEDGEVGYGCPGSLLDHLIYPWIPSGPSVNPISTSRRPEAPGEEGGT